MNECLSPVSTTPAISCSPVTTTPAINPCHDFSMIAGVVENGVKVIARDNNNGEQLSLVTTTPAINLLPVTTNNNAGVKGLWVSIDTPFNGGSNETIGGRV